MSYINKLLISIFLVVVDLKCIYKAHRSSYIVLSDRINLFSLTNPKTSYLSRSYKKYQFRATRVSLAFWDAEILFFILDSYRSSFTYNFTLLYKINNFIKVSSISLLNNWKKTIGEGFIYLRGLFIICVIDATLTDDEPIWEPIEWSLVQSWIMFIFFFAWIAENLITSRYGSYTGRDKRVWFSWYKTFWWVTFYYLLTMGIVATLVITPFYNEITYSLPYVVSWWNWFTVSYFFKFLSTYSIILYFAYFMQLNLRWYNWKKVFTMTALITIVLLYMFYTQFFVSFFAYFTDPSWYHKTRLVDYVQLSHEPNKWSWGTSQRDHFSYHNSKTVFWFKNDGKFAEALLFFNFSFLITLFMFIFYWVVLLRRIYVTQEVSYTYTTYCVSSLKQLLYFFLCLYLFIFFSYFVTYWRLPMEFQWLFNSNSWLSNFLSIVLNYPLFLASLI